MAGWDRVKQPRMVRGGPTVAGDHARRDSTTLLPEDADIYLDKANTPLVYLQQFPLFDHIKRLLQNLDVLTSSF